MIASQEIAVSMQYTKVGAGRKESSECQCGCASKIKDLQNELADCKGTMMEKLKKQLDDYPVPFSEKSFVSDEYVQSFILVCLILNW